MPNPIRWLIYRPAQDCDDSETPYLVCDTEAKAKEITQELQGWLESFALTLPNIKDSNGQDFSGYSTYIKMINEVVPPYGIDSAVTGDIAYPYNTVDKGVFAYKALPYIVTQRKKPVGQLVGSLSDALSGGK